MCPSIGPCLLYLCNVLSLSGDPTKCFQDSSLLHVFCVPVVLWNVMAFTGHSLASHVNSVDFTREAGIGILPGSFLDLAARSLIGL